MTSSIFIGIELIKTSQSAFMLSSSFQIFWDCRIKSVFVMQLMWQSFALSTLHMFSMGLRSGEFAGHFITLNPCRWSHSLVALELWHGALSWTRTHDVSWNQASAWGSRHSSRIEIEAVEFIVPWQTWRGPTPANEKQPQNTTFVGKAVFTEKSRRVRRCPAPLWIKRELLSATQPAVSSVNTTYKIFFNLK